MKVYKTSLSEVFDDSPDNTFFKRIRANPGYKQFEEDLAEIMQQSTKHKKPYNEITQAELDDEN